MDKSKIENIINNSKLLNDLSSENIFDLYLDDNNNIIIEEGCDNYFNFKLSKNELIELSNIFKNLSEKIDD